MYIIFVLLMASASLCAIEIAAYPWPVEAILLTSAFGPDGSLYVSGRSRAVWEERNPACATGTAYKAFLAKIAPTGEMKWVYCVPAGNSFGWQRIAVDASGAAYMAFESSFAPFGGFDDAPSPKPGPENLYLVGLEASGNVRFGRHIRDVSPRDFRMGLDEAGAVYLAGPDSGSQFRPTPGTVNADSAPSTSWLLKVRPDGSGTEYAARPSLKALRDLAILPDGSALVLGSGIPEQGERFVHGAREPLLKTRISNDAGQSWTEYSSAAPDFHYGGIVVHPLDANVLFATGFAGEIVRSNDAGRNWEVWASPGAYIRSIRIHPKRPARMWALISGNVSGASEALFRSDDEGRTWSKAGDCGCSVADYELDPEDPDKLWIVSPRDLLRSFDGGATWRSVAPERFSLITRWAGVWKHPAIHGLLYSSTNAGLAESTDDGEHWSPILPDAPPGAARPSRSALLFDAFDPATFYSLGSQSDWPNSWTGVLRSRDKGRSWEKMASIDAARLAIVSDGSNTVLYSWGSSLGLARSTDGGLTFSSVPFGNGEERYTLSSLVVAPSDNRRMYLSQHRGIDTFVTHIGPGATDVKWTSWIGTFGVEDPYALAVDCSGVIHVAGSTDSRDLFVAGPAIGTLDIFLMALEPDGSALRSITRVGGSGSEVPRFLRAGCDGSVAIGGLTDSRDLPVTEQSVSDLSGYMAWVATLSESGDPAFATYIGASTSTSIVGAAFHRDEWSLVTYTAGRLNVLSAVPARPR